MTLELEFLRRVYPAGIEAGRYPEMLGKLRDLMKLASGEEAAGPALVAAPVLEPASAAAPEPQPEPITHREAKLRLVEAMAKEMGYTLEEVRGTSHRAALVAARGVCMWVLHTRYAMSTVEIGALLNKHHSTVGHSIQMVCERQQDAPYKTFLDLAEETLRRCAAKKA
ncbi:MAG: hypothetical protein KGL39_52750 [Patescibacteria group bacterium]|nr:hypothetical protein [Patescibacteria group bacterium]